MENMVPSEDHIIIGITEQLIIISLLISDRVVIIARQYAFFLNLVLMGEVENLLMEMGDVSCTLNGKSGRIVGESTKMR